MIVALEEGLVALTEAGEILGMRYPRGTVEPLLEDDMEFKPYGPHVFGVLKNGWRVVMLKEGAKTWCTHLILEHEGRLWYSAVTESKSPRAAALEAGLSAWRHLSEKHGILQEGRSVEPR